MKKKLQFGLQPPENVPFAWGARAIFTPTKKQKWDLLWDRQDNFTDGVDASTQNHHEMHEWLKKDGFSALEAKIRETCLRGRDNRTIFVQNDRFILEANPRASYGYLYMVAYPKEVAA